MVLKFHDDPTVNKSEIIIFLGQIWWYARKERVFGRGGEKMKLRGRGDVETIISQN